MLPFLSRRRASVQNPNNPLPAPLSIESLEDRITPAVNLTIQDSVLILTGDQDGDLDDTITIREEGVSGTYTILADDLFVDGADDPDDMATVINITDILVELGGGEGMVTLEGNAAANTGLTGDLTINAGGLRLDILDGAGNFDVAGRFEFNHTGSNPLTVDLDEGGHTFGEILGTDGNSEATITLEGLDVNGFVSFTLGGGEGTVNIGANGAGNGVNISSFLSTIAGDSDDDVFIRNSNIGDIVAFQLGAGRNTLTINPSFIDGDLITLADSNMDRVDIDDTFITGDVSIQNAATGPGSDELQVDIDNSDIGGFLSVISGFGGPEGDVVDLFATTVGDNLGVDLGDSENQLLVRGADGPEGLGEQSVIGGDLFTTSGSSLDFFQLLNSTVFGMVSVQNANPNDGLTADIDFSTIGGFFSVISEADQGTRDRVDIAASTIGGNLGLELNGGENDVNIRGQFIPDGGEGGVGGTVLGTVIEGDLFNSTTDALNDVDFANTTINGSVDLYNTSETLPLHFDAQYSTFNSSVSITSTSADGPEGGPEMVSLHATVLQADLNLELGGGENDFTFSGETVSNDGGEGAFLAPGVIGGNLSTSPTSALNDVTINNASIGGFVSLNNDSSDSPLRATVTNTSINGFLSGISNFDGTDVVAVLGGTIGENLGVHLGEGDNALVLTNNDGGEGGFPGESPVVGGNVFSSSGTNLATAAIQGAVINGDVTLSAPDGTDGGEGFSIVDSLIGGDLTIATNGSDDVVILDNTTVQGDVSYSLGAGMDMVRHSNVNIQGDLNADLGGDNDTISLEDENDTDDLDSRYGGTVSIIAGPGDDTIRVARDVDNIARFSPSATFDGGPGTDELIGSNVAVFLNGFTPISIETFTDVLPPP